MYTELSMSTGCPDEKKRRLVIMAMRDRGRNQLDFDWPWLLMECRDGGGGN